ncbi:GrpB family protein [Alicyclobacillus mengziensis]|uniref:GrpB family protein n=1 Tax=Alicyclobacillus mengziensis TaxID=2931921 RepID=A0A9X7VW02_9BACL|nr:GrpB family protein [Alicyclobacillus mengziensis]QSO45630.1 GrpB family protein [Alicyclobacillus mengziensis]
MEETGFSAFPRWATEPIEIEKYNPNWITQGSHEVQQLLSLLSPFGVYEVEHIGSTSIPTLPSKPILDLMAITPSYDRINDVSDLLGKHQWQYVPPELDNRAWRRFFVKVEDEKRKAHLHLLLRGEPRWEQQLEFRNRLKGNPSLIAEYGNLKVNLAAQFGDDREAYSKAKADFIKHVLGQ